MEVKGLKNIIERSLLDSRCSFRCPLWLETTSWLIAVSFKGGNCNKKAYFCIKCKFSPSRASKPQELKKYE